MELLDDETMDEQERAFVAEMYRQWLVDREINEFVKDRLNGDPIHDYLVQKGRI